jgi:PKD repeat protein
MNRSRALRQLTALATLAVALGVAAAAFAGHGGLSAISIRSDGSATGSAGSSADPTGSADARFVAFDSGAQGLATGVTDGNGETDVYLRDRSGGATALVSHSASNSGATGDGASSGPVVSANGRFVAYLSTATDLVPGQVNVGATDEHVFLYDRETAASVLVDHLSSDGATVGNRAAVLLSAVSSDGRYVVFSSDATDLVAGQADANNARDVFLYDRDSATNRLVTHSSADPATASDGGTTAVFATPDAAFVSFTSTATDIAGGTPIEDVFLWRRADDSFALVSHGSTDPALEADAPSLGLAISADGRWVLFEGDSEDIVPGQTEPPSTGVPGDIFLFDRDNPAATALVSHRAGDATAATSEIEVLEAGLSSDGRYAAWTSPATDIVGPNPDGRELVYLYDRDSAQNRLVSHRSGEATTAANGDAYGTTISPDGATVAYGSTADEIVSGQASTRLGDVFAWNRATGQNILVSHTGASPTQGGDLRSERPRFAGSLLLFESDATNLGSPTPDGNGFKDVFAAGNAAPSVSIAANPASGAAPLDVSFSAAASDLDGSIAGYAWDFGDGATAAGAGASHRYGAPGSYAATVTVTDDSGSSATATRSITVGPAARPTLRALLTDLLRRTHGPCSVRRGTKLALVVCGGNTPALNLRAFVVNASGKRVSARLSAVEPLPGTARGRRPGAAGGRVPYRTLKRPVGTFGSTRFALRPPARLRRALKRALARRGRVARRPLVTLRAGKRKLTRTHRVTVRRKSRGR